MNLYYIKLAIRNLKRHRLYSVLSIIGFSIGFSVCLVIALFLYHELTMDKWFTDYEHVVRVYDQEKNNCHLDIELNREFKENYPEIKLACTVDQSSDMENNAKSEDNYTKFIGLISTTNDFFDVFPISIISNSGQLPFNGKESIIITKSLAETLFPNENPLGKSVVISDYMEGRVSSVIEDFPESSSIQAKILVNAENPDFRLSQNCNDGRCWEPTSHFLMLEPHANMILLQQKMNVDIPKNHPEIKSVALQNFTDIYLSAPMQGNGNITGNAILLLIFLSVGIIVLLLSTINFFNFYISLQYAKLKEIGIKKIHGASFKNLLRFSLIEVSASVLISFTIALLLFMAVVPLASSLLNRNLDASLLLQPSLFLILLTVVAVIILINSIAPTYILSRFKVSSFLAKMQVRGHQQAGRKILTLLQFSASIVLLILVFSIYKQISYAKNADLGFNQEHLVRLNLPFTFNSQDAFKQKLKALSFIESITLSRGVPGEVRLTMGDNNGEQSVMLKSIYVNQDFLNTFNIKLKEGRTFLQGDMGIACLMNEEAIKQYGWENMEGKKFGQGKEGGYPVIGVVKDFHIESIHHKIEPVCMLAADPDKHDELKELSIRLTPGNVGEQMAELSKVWNTFIPDEPLDFRFYDDHFDAMYRQDERLGKAIGVASIIALVLTFMGILGQAFQISLNRTKEIGIRKVNGAGLHDILLEINKEFIIWVGISIIIAIPSAWYLINRWLQNFAYKPEIDGWIFAASALILAVTVVFTVTLQSWRAATKNPVEALRYE